MLSQILYDKTKDGGKKSLLSGHPHNYHIVALFP